MAAADAAAAKQAAGRPHVAPSEVQAFRRAHGLSMQRAAALVQRSPTWWDSKERGDWPMYPDMFARLQAAVAAMPVRPERTLTLIQATARLVQLETRLAQLDARLATLEGASTSDAAGQVASPCALL
jgi:hypothetical protein